MPLVQTLQELGITISRNVIISGVGAYVANDVVSFYVVKWIDEPWNVVDVDLVMSPISDESKY